MGGRRSRGRESSKSREQQPHRTQLSVLHPAHVQHQSQLSVAMTAEYFSFSRLSAVGQRVRAATKVSWDHPWHEALKRTFYFAGSLHVRFVECIFSNSTSVGMSSSMFSLFRS